jgi:hypothetical protein
VVGPLLGTNVLEHALFWGLASSRDDATAAASS